MSKGGTGEFYVPGDFHVPWGLMIDVKEACGEQALAPGQRHSSNDILNTRHGCDDGHCSGCAEVDQMLRTWVPEVKPWYKRYLGEQSSGDEEPTQHQGHDVRYEEPAVRALPLQQGREHQPGDTSGDGSPASVDSSITVPFPIEGRILRVSELTTASGNARRELSRQLSLVGCTIDTLDGLLRERGWGERQESMREVQANVEVVRAGWDRLVTSVRSMSSALDDALGWWDEDD
jgi:hypothetical protein